MELDKEMVQEKWMAKAEMDGWMDCFFNVYIVGLNEENATKKDMDLKRNGICLGNSVGSEIS